MRTRLPAAFVAIFALSAALAHAQHASRAHPAAWGPFRWQGDTLGGRWEPHSAVYVPIDLENADGTYNLQLDTGAGWPRLYEVPLRQVLPRVLGNRAGETAPDEMVVRGRAGNVSMGLRFFRNRVLVLDFPHQRFAIVGPNEAMPPGMPSGITYGIARYERGYLFVPFRVADRAVADFSFDTGASRFALVTTASTWRALTGRTGNEPENIRMSVSAWGKQVEDIGAPVAGSVEVGSVRVARPLVFHQREVPDAPDCFARHPEVSRGLIGNAKFADSNVVVIDFARRRFGIAVTTGQLARYSSVAALLA